MSNNNSGYLSLAFFSFEQDYHWTKAQITHTHGKSNKIKGWFETLNDYLDHNVILFFQCTEENVVVSPDLHSMLDLYCWTQQRHIIKAILAFLYLFWSRTFQNTAFRECGSKRFIRSFAYIVLMIMLPEPLMFYPSVSCFILLLSLFALALC